MLNTHTEIIITVFEHRQQQRIGIHFNYNSALQQVIKTIDQVRWSRTHKCWHLPLNKTCYQTLVKSTEMLATIDDSALRAYLSSPKPTTVATVGRQKKKESAKLTQVSEVPSRIFTANKHVLPAMKQTLILKAYSSSTIRTYMNEMSAFLHTLKNTPADGLEPGRVKDYLQYCFEKLKLSENTLHSRTNALKFYYEQVLRKERFFWEIPRPKKPLQLPHFFNQAEITAIIKAAGNIKHKTMLMLAYASGLRVSEVVQLRTSDIDSKRMCIYIRQAKGKKDRIVQLSPVLLIVLREYWQKLRPSNNGYLFAGQAPNESYSSRSLQLVLAAAKKKAGILKPGSIHALRHSFATHLLDRGTDVTLIMKLLGHNDIKTTLRYLHTSNRDMLGIISPLDDLKL